MIPRNKIPMKLKEEVVTNLMTKQGEMSIRELEVATNLRQSTVAQLLRVMLEKGLIVKREVSKEEAQQHKVIVKGRKSKPPTNVFGLAKKE